MPKGTVDMLAPRCQWVLMDLSGPVDPVYMYT